MNNTKDIFRVAQKPFKASNMLNIESTIEATKKQQDLQYYSFLEDIIYFKLANGINSSNGFTYDTQNQVVMQMHVNDLRSLMYGCKEIYQKGTSSFKNFTEPSLRNAQKGSKKILSLGYENNVYFINIEYQNMRYSYNFDTYSFLSFIDSITIICDETEKTLFNYQRKNDYKMKLNNS